MAVVTHNGNKGQAAREDRWRITDHRQLTNQIQKGTERNQRTRESEESGKTVNVPSYVDVSMNGWENSLEHNYDPLNTHHTKDREVDIHTK